MKHDLCRLKVDVFGERLSMPELAELAGVTVGAIRQRVAAGWDVARILRTPSPQLPERIGIGSIIDDREILGHVESSKSGDRQALCRCKCGNELVIKESDLRAGRKTKCVCNRYGVLVPGTKLTSGTEIVELAFTTSARPGLASQVWRCRCSCKKMFKANGYELKVGHRVWCNAGCPAKKSRQQNIMRDVRSRYVTRLQVGDEELTFKEIAERTGVKPDAIRYRFNSGMPLDRVCGPRIKGK